MVAQLHTIVKIHLPVPFKKVKVKVKVKVAWSCLTFCDPMGWGPPGSSVHGILQARILEWEYWSGELFPFPGDLPNLGLEPRSPTLQEVSLLTATGEAHTLKG